MKDRTKDKEGIKVEKSIGDLKKENDKLKLDVEKFNLKEKEQQKEAAFLEAKQKNVLKELTATKEELDAKRKETEQVKLELKEATNVADF